MASSSSLGRGRGGSGHRSPDAKPAKVKTSWEEQTKLAERLRRIGVSCEACLQGPWYHKLHDGARSCYKYMIAAGTVSSPASVKDMRKEGEATASRATVPEPAGRKARQQKSADLSQTTCALRQSGE